MKLSERERTAIHLASLERTATETRKQLFDARARLALIARLVEDESRIHRAPGAVAGAIRAALFAEPSNLRLLARRFAARRSVQPVLALDEPRVSGTLRPGTGRGG